MACHYAQLHRTVSRSEWIDLVSTIPGADPADEALLHTLRMKAGDEEAFAALDDEATKGWAIAQVMEHEAQKQGVTRRQMIEGWMRKALAEDDPQSWWLKATDIDTGEMVAGAHWKYQPADLAKQDVERKTAAQTDTRPSLFAEFGREWREFRDEFFPAQAYYNLSALVTHPKWQRQGAGGMLVQWGCEKADEGGLVACLHASSAGLGVYKRYGFEVVKAGELDMRPFGVDAIEPRAAMIRKPRART